MVEDECGPVDGHAAERVATTLIALAAAEHAARHDLTALSS
jgi:hypothetical protein